LLVERKVVDPLAGASDVALDPRVVLERDLLLDSDPQSAANRLARSESVLVVKVP
jgi:hypothetical protein